MDFGNNMWTHPPEWHSPNAVSAIVYYMVGMRDGFEYFATFVLINFLFSTVAYTLGLFISSAVHNQAVALQVEPLIMLPFMLLSGFYLSLDSIPVYLRWVEAISFIKYGFRALIVNEFEGRSWTCHSTDPNCISTGDGQIASLGMEDASVWEDCAVLAGFIAGFYLVSYLLLRFARGKRA